MEKYIGMRDFLFGEMNKRDYIENAVREVFESFGYKKIQTPTVESYELVAAKSGEEIRERMFIFEDYGGRRVALRPEMTAPVCRMFISEIQDKFQLPIRLCYFSNCFRYDNPQRGRYREFWQAGIELIGSKRPEADAEVIAISTKIIESVGIKPINSSNAAKLIKNGGKLSGYYLQIGHLGILRSLTEEYMDKRSVNNMISLIDTKKFEELEKLLKEKNVPKDTREVIFKLIDIFGSRLDVMKKVVELLSNSPSALEKLDNLNEILEWLELFGVKEYVIDFGIARGLDYYTGIVFEMRVPSLGAQAQICGGGRYDDLIEFYGGKSIPATGFAFGFDRLINAIEDADIDIKYKIVPQVMIIYTNDEMIDFAILIASELREDNISVIMDPMGRKFEKTLSYANANSIPYVIIVGPQEIKEGNVMLKDMITGTQEEVSLKDLKYKLKNLLTKIINKK